VCFTHVGGNEKTRRLAENLNATGKVAVTPSQIDGTWFIRVSIGQTHTEERHVEGLWQAIDELA
jgi:aromatic-L-amino-acid decarboxylase